VIAKTALKEPPDACTNAPAPATPAPPAAQPKVLHSPKREPAAPGATSPILVTNWPKEAAPRARVTSAQARGGVRRGEEDPDPPSFASSPSAAAGTRNAAAWTRRRTSRTGMPLATAQSPSRPDRAAPAAMAAQGATDHAAEARRSVFSTLLKKEGSQFKKMKYPQWLATLAAMMAQTAGERRKSGIVGGGREGGEEDGEVAG